MNTLNKGEVAFTVDGVEHVLKPSLTAFSQLGSEYPNYFDLLSKIASNNVPAMVRVLRLGLGFNDTQAKKLPDIVFRAGTAELRDPLSDYVFRLFNGGRSAEEMIKAQEAEAKEEKEERDPLLAG